MPIRSLESYLFERGLVGCCPIESIKNARLGIDVDHYMSRLLTPKREQYLDAIGGSPTTLTMFLESDLQIFRELNITPVFVFNGFETFNQMEHNQKENEKLAKAGRSTIFPSRNNITNTTNNNGNDTSTRINSPYNSASSSINSLVDTSSKELSLIQRNRAWSNWNTILENSESTYIDQPLFPNEPFRFGINPIDTRIFKANLIRYFIEHNIQYQVAPFVSWFQLAYLLQNDYIDAIYGSTDLLLLSNIDRFILGMEFPSKEMRFVDRIRIFNEFQVSQEEFVDIAMTCGNPLQPEVLPPLQIYPITQVFEVGLNMVLANGTDFYYYLLSNEPRSVSKYEKGVSSLRNMPVLFENGRVSIFTPNAEDKSKIPNNAHEFISQRLPHEYYFYYSLGLITSGKLLDAICSGVYKEDIPLGSMFIPSYRTLVDKSIDDFKSKELNLLTAPINRYYQIKAIKHLDWFGPKETNISHKMSPSVFERMNHILVKTDKDEPFTVANFIKLFDDKNADWESKFFVADVIFPNNIELGKKLRTPYDLLSTVLLRFLILLGFFDVDYSKKTLKATKYGEIFLNFNSLGIEDGSEFLVLLMFMKYSSISLNDSLAATENASSNDAISYNSSLSKFTLDSYPIESRYITIISRLMLLFSFPSKPFNYHGPIDRSLLCFRDYFQFVQLNMSEMFDSVCVSCLCSGEFDRLSLKNNSEWVHKIVAQMLFKLPIPNTLMAMMWEFYLQKCLHNGSIGSEAEKMVSDCFHANKLINGDIKQEVFKKGFKIISQFSSLIKECNRVGITNERDYEIYKNAVLFAQSTFEVKD
ncbi:related to Protein MKT1 [Saccharomycodes ludwigii]|uniref:Related to Protein MKT1 n=1 Tax=Saccharomycodes ludwigii TaxID=36035 RepID=A0A376BBQ2_9ASCO|nr:hypothetical protein SCDLUD_002835 [Saccharomycodes ludwigii]KAH3901344.1 hypothetical protein SCDLUD_002835 [Saccharomycodes ludwigii]SSD62021.1 related to Protein MKT1 [Saccharomycodes ludwigii]